MTKTMKNTRTPKTSFPGFELAPAASSRSCGTRTRAAEKTFPADRSPRRLRMRSRAATCRGRPPRTRALGRRSGTTTRSRAHRMRCEGFDRLSQQLARIVTIAERLIPAHGLLDRFAQPDAAFPTEPRPRFRAVETQDRRLVRVG